MEFSLISEQNVKIFNLKKKLTNLLGLGIVMFLAIVFGSMIYANTFTVFGFIAFSSLITIVYPLLWLPLAISKKAIRSKVNLTEKTIKVISEKGECWREIPYSFITEIRVEEIEGWFYGFNQELYRHKYICLFMNNNSEIPIESYKKMFLQKDFFMIAYSEELLDNLQKFLIKE